MMYCITKKKTRSCIYTFGSVEQRAYHIKITINFSKARHTEICFGIWRSSRPPFEQDANDIFHRI